MIHDTIKQVMAMNTKRMNEEYWKIQKLSTWRKQLFRGSVHTEMYVQDVADKIRRLKI
jgi:hypothetical protein